MKNTHAIAGLVKKRSTLAGDIEHHQKQAEKLRHEFDSIGRAIKVLDPDYRLERIKPRRFKRRNAFFKSGECGRVVLEVLRDAQWHYTTHEVAVTVAEARELDLDDVQFKALTATVRTALKGLKARNIVKVTSRVDYPRWGVRQSNKCSERINI